MPACLWAFLLLLHMGLCAGQLYYERNPSPVETLPFDGGNYDEDYTEGYYDFMENKDVYRWNVGEYPHPQKNFRYCNRMRESFVCDPDQVLDREEADKLDTFIRQLYKETPCICDQCKADEGGIVVGIALLKTLFQPYNQHPSKTIRTFAETLRNMWKLGRCDNDILIVVATTDRLSFTDVGRATSSYVSLDEAHRVFLEHKSHFSSGHFYEGLRAMLGDYHSRTRDMKVAVPGGDDRDMGVVAGSIVGAVAVLGVLLFVGFVVYRHCKNRRAKDVETADEDKIDSKSEGVSSSWTKSDIKVLYNSLKSTDKTQQSSTKYQPCETDEAQATKKDSFTIGDEVIDTTLAVPDNPDDTQLTTVTEGDSSTTAMLDRELTEAVEGIAQTFKPKREFRGHETDL